jgi:acylphosphatase
VQNADMRTVERVVQGAEADANAMLAWLRHGPPSETSYGALPIAVAPALPPFGIAR